MRSSPAARAQAFRPCRFFSAIDYEADCNQVAVISELVAAIGVKEPGRGHRASFWLQKVIRTAQEVRADRKAAAEQEIPFSSDLKRPPAYVCEALTAEEVAVPHPVEISQVRDWFRIRRVFSVAAISPRLLWRGALRPELPERCFCIVQVFFESGEAGALMHDLREEGCLSLRRCDAKFLHRCIDSRKPFRGICERCAGRPAKLVSIDHNDALTSFTAAAAACAGSAIFYLCASRTNSPERPKSIKTALPRAQQGRGNKDQTK